MLISVIYGYTLGYSKINHESITNYYITIGPFAGITSANLNSSTVTNPLLLPKDQSNVAFFLWHQYRVWQKQFWLFLFTWV